VDDELAVHATIQLLLERTDHSFASDGCRDHALIEEAFDLRCLDSWCREWTGSKRCGSPTNRTNGGSGSARSSQHNSNEICGIPCAELLHDIGAMIFDRTRADAEFASGFLVGGTGCEAL
jgi:hypothetical protein